MQNKVMIIGRLTKDPELTKTKNGISSLRFTLAVQRQLSNTKGEKQVDFINLTAWRATAENMAKFLKKGSLISVEGRIETGSFQGKDGKMVYTTDIIANVVQFLEGKSSQATAPQQPVVPFPQAPQQQPQHWQQQAVGQNQGWVPQQQPSYPQQPAQPQWQQQAVGQNQGGWMPQQQPVHFNESNLPF